MTLRYFLFTCLLPKQAAICSLFWDERSKVFSPCTNEASSGYLIVKDWQKLICMSWKGHRKVTSPTKCISLWLFISKCSLPTQDIFSILIPGYWGIFVWHKVKEVLSLARAQTVLSFAVSAVMDGSLAAKVWTVAKTTENCYSRSKIVQYCILFFAQAYRNVLF